MKELIKLELTILEDRGTIKLRINQIKDNRVFGTLRTVYMKD